MSLPQGLFPVSWLVAGSLVYAALVIWAGAGIDWRRLQRHTTRQHLLLAGSIAVMMLWSAGREIIPSIGGHFLGMTALTLLVGWRQAMVGSLLPVVGVVVVGIEPWPTAGLAGLMLAALPIGSTYLVWRVSARFLSRGLFTCLGLSTFFGSVLAIVLTRAGVSGLLAGTGIYALDVIGREYLSILPIALTQEALVNLLVITALALFRPHWLQTIQQRQYFSR